MKEASQVDTTDPRIQKRLQDSLTSSANVARQTTKIGNQGSQTNNGLSDDDEQP